MQYAEENAVVPQIAGRQDDFLLHCGSFSSMYSLSNLSCINCSFF